VNAAGLGPTGISLQALRISQFYGEVSTGGKLSTCRCFSSGGGLRRCFGRSCGFAVGNIAQGRSLPNGKRRKLERSKSSHWLWTSYLAAQANCDNHATTGHVAELKEEIPSRPPPKPWASHHAIANPLTSRSDWTRSSNSCASVSRAYLIRANGSSFRGYRLECRVSLFRSPKSQLSETSAMSQCWDGEACQLPAPGGRRLILPYAKSTFLTTG